MVQCTSIRTLYVLQVYSYNRLYSIPVYSYVMRLYCPICMYEYITIYLINNYLFSLIALSQLKRATRFWPLATSDSVLLHVDAGRAQIQGLLSLVAPETAPATAASAAAPSALELQQQIIVFERQSLCLPLLPSAPPRFAGRQVLVLRACIQ